MFQLILTLVAIALTAAAVYATLSVAPIWSRLPAEQHELALAGVQRLENAFTLYALAHSETEAAVTADADGGVAANFLPYLRVNPPAPASMQWVYGQHANDGSAYSQLYYFCLVPKDVEGINRPTFEALLRLQQSVNSAQGFLSAACDATSSDTSYPGAYPTTRTFTYFVAYVPGAP